jgi:hypothetical protein
MTTRPTVVAEIDPKSNDLPRFNGTIVGCYRVPVEINGIGRIDFKAPVMLAAGETLEYWLVVDADGEHYEARVHRVGCKCGGKCK